MEDQKKDISIYELERHKQVWPVYDKYEIEGDWVVAASDEEGDPPSYLKARKYNPYLEQDLYLEFAKIERVNGHKKLLRFVHRYGLPGVSARLCPDHFRASILQADSLMLVYHEASVLKNALDLWEMLQGNSSDDDNRISEWVRYMGAGGLWENYRVIRGMEKASDRELALASLADSINGCISGVTFGGVTPCFFPGRSGTIVQGWSSGSLAATAWLQAAFFISDEKRLRRCARCGNYFELNRSDRVHCAYCYKAAKMQRYRERKKKEENS